MLLTEECSYTGLPVKLDLHSQIFVRAMFIFCRNIRNAQLCSTAIETQRRSKNLSCSNITVESSTCLTVKKAQFVSNPGNKQRFIDLLSEYLIRSGFSCLNAQYDADVLICRTAVTLLQTKCNVTVVGDDTDLLVILIDMTRNLSLNRRKIFLSTKTNLYDLNSVITSLGVKGASSILLLHSFTGCDTVSRIFGVGQGRLLNIRGKLTESIIQTFYSHDSTKEEIKSAG